MEFSKKQFGELAGRPVYEYTLKNKQGLSLSALNFGGTVTGIRTPDRKGQFKNIVLGFDDIEDYVQYRPFYGCLVGRTAGRIDEGKFTLAGETYQLQQSEGKNHHHGGNPAFDAYLWDTALVEDGDTAHLVFSYFSPDGENGYPGNLDVKVTYTLTEANEWIIHYEATTDKPTLFNPTNHIFFNLTGNHEQTIKQHLLQIKSDRVAEVRADLIPTGKLMPVEGTDFDLREPQPLVKAIESDHPQLKMNGGLDTPFLLTHEAAKPDAILSEANSGRQVSITTDRDAVVVYTHNGVSGDYQIDGKKVEPYAGVALETQQLPDAIHHEHFGHTILYPGEVFHSETIFQFEQDQ